MKKFICLMILSISMVCFGATTGTGEWIEKGSYPVYKITYAIAPTVTSDAFTFNFSGMVYRIVVRGTSNDSDADITFTDVSGAAYATFTNLLSSAVFDYCVYSTDINSNVYGGVNVAGLNTVTIAAGDGLGVTYIYIYCGK